MSERRPRQAHGAPIWGIVLLFLGIVFLLQALDVLPWGSGDAVALLAGVDNHNRPQYPSQPLQSLDGERADICAAVGLPG